MIQTLKNAWKVIELRKKLLFTLFMIILFRLGSAIPVPHIDAGALSAAFKSTELGNTILGLYNVMSGSAFQYGTVFALSIQPYINASIIIQLLAIAIPALERLSKEGGEEGKRKLENITRYTTVGITLLQAYGYYVLLSSNNALADESFLTGLVIVATLVAGSCLVMWMGEQITEFGIGNGISMILFAGIIARVPNVVVTMFNNLISNPSNWRLWVMYPLMIIGGLAMIVLIVIVTNAERRIPVMYSKRVVGRKVYGGQSTHLPLKVNMSGVLPVIFAGSIASLPATIGMFFNKTSLSEGGWGTFLRLFNQTSPLYMVIYFLLIIFFSYFYSTIQFNPIEVSNNLMKNGGYIPGFRPGKPTSAFIAKVLNKVTLFGAIYLAVIALVPLIVGAVFPTAGNSGISVGGTSLIIVVGVALETVKALEAQLIMRNYKGFLE